MEDVARGTFQRSGLDKMVAMHYGYDKIANNGAYWENSPNVFERLGELSKVLNPNKRVRVTFDYDPDYERTLLQVEEL